MKYFAMLLSASALAVGLTGCISEEVEPQEVVVRQVDGSQIIFKDLYEINSDRAIDFGNSRVFPLYHCHDEGLPGDYTMNIVAMEPKRTSALFTQKTSQVIYVLAGGGMIDIDGRAYELREGVTLYIPADRKMRVINNSPYILKYMEIALPCGSAQPIILEKAPEPEVAAEQELSDKDLLKKSTAITGNAATSPTLDQIDPVTLDEVRKPVEGAPSLTGKAADDSDRANAAIIKKADNIIDPPPVAPVDQTAVKTLTTEEKIMQDKK